MHHPRMDPIQFLASVELEGESTKWKLMMALKERNLNP